ncbi:MAG: hypothetical protein ABW049_08440 [Spongiibacteraceae bacterium]
MTTDLSSRFSLPTQDRGTPSATQSNPAVLAQWLESLPKTNLGQTTRSLYEGITELNRVTLSPALRLQQLEVMRPAIYFAAAGLRRHYLNQPIVLPEQAQKVTRLAHVLFQELATGYTLVAVHTLENEKQSGFSQPRQGIATALHRALVDHTHNLLRDALLYREPRRGCWHALHQTAALAWEQQLERFAVADVQAGDSTLEAAYLRALLLGSTRAHQLRQDDLIKTFSHLLDWSRLVSLCGSDQGLFVIDSDTDDGPIYREHFHRQSGADAHTLGLDTLALGEHLYQQRNADDEALVGQHLLSNDLLAHLTLAWTTASNRAFLRMDANEPIELALGLTATHHFCADEIDFALLLSKEGFVKTKNHQGNPFLRVDTPSRESRPRDVWDSPFLNTGLAQISVDSIDFSIRNQHKAAEGSKDKDKYRFHAVETVNISPGGFCLKWPPESAAQIRTGEIVGIRERNHKNWSIGVIRWVRLLESGPQLGIELLSPTATPFGARVIQKTGPQGEFQRVLVLPEMKQSGQTTTLITPRLPFRSGQKIVLVYRDKETRIQLVRRLMSTTAFSQFEFRRIGTSAPTAGPGTETKTPGADSGFDGLWDSL